jgi:hypothetical protein
MEDRESSQNQPVPRNIHSLRIWILSETTPEMNLGAVVIKRGLLENPPLILVDDFPS